MQRKLKHVLLAMTDQGQDEKIEIFIDGELNCPDAKYTIDKKQKRIIFNYRNKENTPAFHIWFDIETNAMLSHSRVITHEDGKEYEIVFKKMTISDPLKWIDYP